jgi:putative addiction module component (TIGR02574 family)
LKRVRVAVIMRMRCLKTKADRIVYEALSLPVEIRAKMAEELLKSLNPVREEIDMAWAEEAERRLAEIKTGKKKAAPA